MEALAAYHRKQCGYNTMHGTEQCFQIRVVALRIYVKMNINFDEYCFDLQSYF